MSTHKNIDLVCILVLALTLLLTAAFMNGEKLGIRVIADEDAESYSGSLFFTANDLDGAWDDNAYTTFITLSGDSAEIKGNGAYAFDGGVVITNGGWYVLSGTLTDGSIVVDAYDSSKVWLRLEGVDVTCSDDACLIVDQADKVFLTLAAGTENSFTGGENYSAAALEDNTGGVIFAHDDLTINGSGSLTIKAGCGHGIDANDSLVITGGRIRITAPQDGIHANDSFRFTAADLTIDAGDDAIHSDAELYVESGTILITECYEGLEGMTIHIAGGDITVYSRDDGINANGSVAMVGFGGMNGMAGMPGGGTEDSGPASDSEVGAPPKMVGVFPGMTVEAPAAQGASAAETYIRITGGTITIINDSGNDADGLDSNGSIYLDGGTLRISLKGDGSNCAIDFGSESGGEAIVTGGTIVACGGTGMAEAFSSGSTQCAVLYNLSSPAAAGTAFRVLDADGSEVLSYTPQCSYSCVAFSAPALAVGETYTVWVGDTADELTLSETATEVGFSGMGGMGAVGGGKASGETGRGDELTPPAEGWGSFGEPPERPSPPDRAENGEARPERPSPWDAESGSGGMGRNPDTGQRTAVTAAESTAEAPSVSAGTWLLLAASLLALALGVLFAGCYKRY